MGAQDSHLRTLRITGLSAAANFRRSVRQEDSPPPLHGRADGGNPCVGFVFRLGGKLYGVTDFGGQTNARVVFAINP